MLLMFFSRYISNIAIWNVSVSIGSLSWLVAAVLRQLFALYKNHISMRRFDNELKFTA